MAPRFSSPSKTAWEVIAGSHIAAAHGLPLFFSCHRACTHACMHRGDARPSCNHLVTQQSDRKLSISPSLLGVFPPCADVCFPTVIAGLSNVPQMKIAFGH